MPENAGEVATGRRPFVAALLAQIPDVLVVSGLGSATYDVFAAGHRPAMTGALIDFALIFTAPALQRVIQFLDRLRRHGLILDRMAEI